MQRPVVTKPFFASCPSCASWLAALLLIVLTAAAALAAGRTLDIYFIDTEGGQATLFVSPSGETFMIDVGFAGLDTPNPDKDAGRDAARIADAGPAGPPPRGISRSAGPAPRTWAGCRGAAQSSATRTRHPGNPADSFSANLEDTDNTMHPAHHLKVSAGDDGSFTVFNSRTNETKRYAARKAATRSNQTR